MLKASLILALVIFAKLIYAQPSGYKAMADETRFKNQLALSSKSVNSISSDFTQEKVLSLLDEKVVSKGTFLFKKDNKVRMEYTHPFSYLLVINGDKISIRDQQKSNTFSAGSNKLFGVINNIIIDCVKGTALDNQDFTHKLYASENSSLVILTPIKKDLKQYFKAIHVYLNKTDYSVVKIDMMEPSGDNTLITFTNKKINVTIPDAEFTIK